jgi:hypothetical protein
MVEDFVYMVRILCSTIHNCSTRAPCPREYKRYLGALMDQTREPSSMHVQRANRQAQIVISLSYQIYTAELLRL